MVEQRFFGGLSVEETAAVGSRALRLRPVITTTMKDRTKMVSR